MAFRHFALHFGMGRLLILGALLLGSSGCGVQLPDLKLPNVGGGGGQAYSLADHPTAIYGYEITLPKSFRHITAEAQQQLGGMFGGGIRGGDQMLAWQGPTDGGAEPVFMAFRIRLPGQYGRVRAAVGAGNQPTPTTLDLHEMAGNSMEAIQKDCTRYHSRTTSESINGAEFVRSNFNGDLREEGKPIQGYMVTAAEPGGVVMFFFADIGPKAAESCAAFENSLATLQRQGSDGASSASHAASAAPPAPIRSAPPRPHASAPAPQSSAPPQPHARTAPPPSYGGPSRSDALSEEHRRRIEEMQRDADRRFEEMMSRMPPEARARFEESRRRMKEMKERSGESP